MIVLLLLIFLLPHKSAAERLDSIPSRFSMGASFAITVPSSSFLSALRSVSENRAEITQMAQDIEEKFSDNDVAVAVGCPMVFRQNSHIRFYGDLSWFGFSNGNKWTPKEGDTIITTARVNRYRFDFITVGLGVQLDLPDDFMSATNYSRLYLITGATAYPLLRTEMERTALFGKVTDYGQGVGVKIGFGGEKRISAIMKMCGELSYEYSNFGLLRSSEFTLRRISFDLKLLWNFNRFNQQLDGETR